MTCGSLTKRLHVTKVPSFRIDIGTILVVLTKVIFYEDEIARARREQTVILGQPAIRGLTDLK
jgi:hypothetical protein